MEEYAIKSTIWGRVLIVKSSIAGTEAGTVSLKTHNSHFP